MAILFPTSCCGCDLRGGVLLIVIFGLLSASYTIYSSFNFYKILSAEMKDTSNITTLKDMPVDHKYYKAVTSLGLVGVVFGGISIVVNLLLLWSFDSKNRYLAYPYLFWNIFMLPYTFGVTIFFIAIWNGFQYVFVVNVLLWLLSIYLIIVVYSYIQTHPSAFDREPVAVMQMQPRPPPYAKLQEVTAQ